MKKLFFALHIQRLNRFRKVVNRLSKWQSRLESLDSNERDTLLGTSLSKLFTKLPLWLSHPANIGGFYGLLVAVALLLPYRFASDDHTGWLADWGLHCCLLLVACFFLGICSTIIISITGRFPTAPPRSILYPMPFIGLALLTIDRTDILEIPAIVSWLLMLLPGPMYVHLSWAPRWRLLCMIEDGRNPFEAMEDEEKEYESFSEDIESEDAEMMSVVDDFESE
uniref:Uncharacterized protein n=1 Tax=uncultured Poseidoniia archaeon TaxID=1697135 RepID=A0A1B1TE41_9ARCH|nr:hypothetical protein MG2_1342 [uncultured Candidatus Thalassoarchaea sp.]